MKDWAGRGKVNFVEERLGVKGLGGGERVTNKAKSMTALYLSLEGEA
jgi:hypothetical protein